MKRDEKLVRHFLAGYNKLMKAHYSVVALPDQIPLSVSRRPKAVEAIAEDDERNRLAIEHTLIEPFEGERADTQRFKEVLAPLESDPSLVVPEYDIDVFMKVGAIPTRIRWREVGLKVREWFRDNARLLPDGPSAIRIPGLAFDLTLFVGKSHEPGYPGRVWSSRAKPPDSLANVIIKALKKKVPKLAQTPADKRFLLLEKADIVNPYRDISLHIQQAAEEVLDLAGIDEIWIVNTAVWEREQGISCYRIWPNGVSLKFHHP